MGASNMEVRDREGCCPLSLAAKNGHASVINMLLNAGGNAESQAENVLLPLILAVWEGHEGVV